tara:strand:- start:193 stop:447 length:255 start_codon:yes stop_codon:yes gene_type:complete
MMTDFFNDMLNVVMNEANKEENIKKINVILDPYIKKIEMKFYFFIILLYLIYIVTLVIIIFILFYYKTNLVIPPNLTDTSMLDI